MTQTKVDDTVFQNWLAERRARDVLRWAEIEEMEAEHRAMDVHMHGRAFRAPWRLLRSQGLKVTPQNVAGLTARQLMAEENFGRKSLTEVEAWLDYYGLRLQEDPKPWSHSGGLRPASLASLAAALETLHA